MKNKSMTRKEFLAQSGMALGAMALASGRSPLSAAESPSSLKKPGSLPCRLVQIANLSSPLDSIYDLKYNLQGELLLAGDKTVKIIDESGAPLREHAFQDQVHSASCDLEGMLYVAHGNTLSRIDPKGQVSSFIPEGMQSEPFQYITSLACSERGLYVADAGERKITRFALNGDKAESYEDFHIPSAYFDCEVDPAGNLVVAHTSRHQVETYDSTGEVARSWGKFGGEFENFCGCCNPTNIAILSNGWVATTEKGIPRMKVYDSTGHLMACLTTEDLGLSVNRNYLSTPGGEIGKALPCHDGWPGMPMSVHTKDRIALSIPVLNQVRIYEIQPA